MIDRLILVRHGETTWNARKVLQGQADIELSERGRAQALELRELLLAWTPHAVVCSDLVRTRQTADCLGYPQPALDARWREADLGQWTGVAAELLMREQGERYQRWRDGLDAPPGGETFEQLRQRVRAAIDDLSASSGNVLVVTHGGAIRAALAELLGLGPDRIVPVDPASATVIQIHPGPRLVAFNAYRHPPVKETTD